MTADHEQPDPLSADGARRRDAILTHAQQALVGRVRACRARRSRGALAALAVASAAALLMIPQPTSPTKAAPSVSLVKDEPPTPLRTPIERLDDEAMLAALAELGVDAGLIEVDGEQQLVSRDGKGLDLRRRSREGGRRDG